MVLLAGFVLGAGTGTLVKVFTPNHELVLRVLTWIVRPVEQLFLGTLFVLIIPLLFSAIIGGVSRMRGEAGMPGLLMTTLAYMLAVSASAALIGLAMANLFRPGDGIPPEIGHGLLSMHVPHFPHTLRNLAPDLHSANGALTLMVIASCAVAAALPLLRKRNRQWLHTQCEKLFVLGMETLALVTRFAPLAVTCFVFDMTVMLGWHLLVYLSAYIIVVITALALQIGITFFVVVWMRGDLAPGVFLRSVQEAALIAFSTSSSNATLPTALKVAENDLQLPARIARLVLGIGAVSNQSGTTIYIAVTVLFVGQFFGTDLTLGGQGMVFMIATLAGMGTIGVPAGALPVVATVLALTGLPPEGIGLVIGVDRLLDMFRTLVNVVGDLAIAVAISRELPLAGTEPRLAAIEAT
ncbi:dicarboxylate/amino acid:cation symporter [Novosphingobium sp. 9U]|uniref:dicarboxylate/amino acid:cation symporter n=1 Tax=Novosphingobium sp. 9U TaxID=2653158 RepID=UPI0012F3FCD7|nr:dicarboxylate/amino acid:cation symporter [Novosphingobium sp. 9U]VWX54593.1 Dicarboxylate/amino acid:cation (Na+ or H+) symporter, DAACS family [Novosphingobium sp. 9U]